MGINWSKPIAIAAILSTLAAVPARAETLPDTIRFGAFGQGFGQPFGVALLAIAHVKGFIADEFKDTPVKLEWTYLTGTGPAINEAIANGQLDFAQYGGLPNIIGRANGLPTRILMSYGQTTIVGAARTGLPIELIKDLKGRKVAFQKGTILHWAFLKALEANGLSGKDVTIVDLKTADQLAALAAGSIDASIGTSSLFPLRDQGVVKIFYTSRDAGPKAVGFGGNPRQRSIPDQMPRGDPARGPRAGARRRMAQPRGEPRGSPADLDQVRYSLCGAEGGVRGAAAQAIIQSADR